VNFSVKLTIEPASEIDYRISQPDWLINMDSRPIMDAQQSETVVSGADVAGNAGDLSVFTGSAQQTAPTSEAKEPTTQNAAANCGNEEPKVDGECVLHTLNTILEHYKMPLATAADLDKHLPTIVTANDRCGTTASALGHADGTLDEGEAVIQQARLYLKEKLGDGNYKFINVRPSSIRVFQDREDGFLLVHGCLNRSAAASTLSHEDPLDKQWYMQLITQDADEIGKEFNKDWMHVILIRNSRFYCHNLKDWTNGVSLQHLGLGANGQPTNLEYYMRFISRAYWIQLEQQPANMITQKRGAESKEGTRACKKRKTESKSTE
jgi:hypothetical protein